MRSSRKLLISLLVPHSSHKGVPIGPIWPVISGQVGLIQVQFSDAIYTDFLTAQDSLPVEMKKYTSKQMLKKVKKIMLVCEMCMYACGEGEG